MAPAVIFNNFPHPLMVLHSFYPLLHLFTKPGGYFDFSANFPFFFADDTIRLFCQEMSPLAGFCESFLSMGAGYNKYKQQVDISIIPNMWKYVSHYASINQFLHYIQLLGGGPFKRYDYYSKNKKIYGSSSPPVYNLTLLRKYTFIADRVIY